ncbi:MAG: NHLP leader peptide family RiPP precursor [Pseudanabaenaceae cyanobacterium SKYGB_i_bin29]|nr:NHLP leader peptide family RiPP precursor [Pseudanabaenaceae cyanobacterium SKYG29]MDW8421664.1 NHLP leader peptide family RiPP precursor [Pseudanabaenaceae cyanobacterium SKYGB_i_bin29]
MDKKQLESEIIERAWRDEGFRQLLLADPKRAIGEVLGWELPAHITIHVLEEQTDTLYLVIPPNPNAKEEKALSPEELDLVAGGSMFTVMGPQRLSLCLICP